MENTIAIETTDGDIITPSDNAEIINSWTESGLEE